MKIRIHGEGAISLNELEELKAKIEVATQALEDIMVDPTWGLEHEKYMRCRDALRKLKEGNSDD